jgi:hypothetical protein
MMRLVSFSSMEALRFPASSDPGQKKGCSDEETEECNKEEHCALEGWACAGGVCGI